MMNQCKLSKMMEAILTTIIIYIYWYKSDSFCWGGEDLRKAPTDQLMLNFITVSVYSGFKYN